jgi:feruloyl-CoA synthase
MNAGYRQVRFGPRAVEKRILEDGTVFLRSSEPLAPHPLRLTERLKHWARHTPDQVFLARRNSNGTWVQLTYAQCLERVERIAQSLLDRGLGQNKTVAILSENSLEHGLLALAALHVGVPYAPISTAYSLISSDFGKLRHTLSVMQPGLVLVSDGHKFQAALAATISSETEVVFLENAPQLAAGVRVTAFEELLNTPVTKAVETAFLGVLPDAPAKILFTSGSTGLPKGVINTQRMICANQQQILQAYPLIADDTPPVLIDWLPWNHTFGGNHNFGIALYNGGSLFIDDGRPTNAGIAQTLKNLAEIAPTVYFNVPKGFEELLPWLRQDTALAQHFFSRLKLIFYAGAGMPQHIWDALEEVSLETCGERITISSGLGCTESAPSALFANWSGGFAGLLGLPVAGLELKLIPEGDKLEVRYRGANVTPGYYQQPDSSLSAFDEDGFYCTGDALRFVDVNQPEQGLVFDGRIAEDFKLNTGTWVSVGAMRAKVVATGAPWVQDAVITGHDRAELGVLLFPNLMACRTLTGLSSQTPVDELLEHPRMQQALQQLLQDLQQQSTGSANRVARGLIVGFAPSIDLGEITDKGSLNQRAVLKHRAELVEQLYSVPQPKGYQ